MIKKHIHSTQPPARSVDPDTFKPNPPAPRNPTSHTCHVTVDIINTTADKDFRNMIVTDLSGSFPITSAHDHKYLFVMFDTDSNFINAVLIKNKSTPKLLRGFKICHGYLKKRWFHAQLLWLDNEVSKNIIEPIESKKLTYQPASPGGHHNNPAERAI